ncbi:MAG: C40 family peptidase [Ignavibacteria bacterium]|jgi:cell wall-associated NlpC family hydrolase|nr:C40 family peptidase [Ignavibacteria bacterium]
MRQSLNNSLKFSVCTVILIAVFAFLAGSNDAFAKKSSKSAKKTKIKSTQVLQQRKAERLQKLYQYFPQYETWEQAEIYPYNDMAFLNNYDRTSIYEDFFKRRLLLERINDWLGVPYRLPGRSRAGVDCSNFVSIIVSEVLNMNIPAGAATQATLFRKIKGMDSLQFGDIIFFSGRNKHAARIGHTGIYIGNGLFAHSSTNHGVTYTLLSEGYYKERFRHGGRINGFDITTLAKK